jgi:hypothetical protein
MESTERFYSKYLEKNKLNNIVSQSSSKISCGLCNKPAKFRTNYNNNNNNINVCSQICSNLNYHLIMLNINQNNNLNPRTFI